MTNFWLNDPNILLNRNHIAEIWPNSEFDLARKLNAITRIIILLTLLGYFLTKSMKVLISAVVALVVLVILYKTKSNKVTKESFRNLNKVATLDNLLNKEFTMPTKKNPVMNVLMNEYKYNPKRKQAAPAYSENVLEKINKKAQTQDPKLYKNLGDNLTFENSMRNFYAMPNTTIPNNQKDFALFCYGNMPSCKEGDSLQCTKNNAGLRTT